MSTRLALLDSILISICSHMSITAFHSIVPHVLLLSLVTGCTSTNSGIAAPKMLVGVIGPIGPHWTLLLGALLLRAVMLQACCPIPNSNSALVVMLMLLRKCGLISLLSGNMVHCLALTPITSESLMHTKLILSNFMLKPLLPHLLMPAAVCSL